jgi:hypothetical protein
MQTSNGSGSMADGGCSMVSGVLTCGSSGSGLVQFVEGTAPASPTTPYTGALFQDSADHHFKVKLVGGTVIDLSAGGILAAPYISGTFTSQTHVTITAATHGFSTKG